MSVRALLLFILASIPFRTFAQSHAENHVPAIDWSRYQDQAVQLLQQYLRIDTSNPPGNEVAAAEFFHRLFDQFGIQHTVFNYVPGRANVYAVLKGDGSLKPIVLLNHMDVVRADPKHWRVPPFSGEIVDGEIYGRGAVDMKGEGLLHLMVMLIAARERLPLKRDLIFLATADEEVGDSGSAWLIQNHPELVQGAQYLITEGGSSLMLKEGAIVYRVGVAEKAPLWLRLTASGRGGHGSIPISDSAPNRLVRAMERVVQWQTPIRLLPSVEEYFHEIAALEKQPRASQFRNIRRALGNRSVVKSLSAEPKFNYLFRNTISLTVLKGSEQTNVIPAAAYAQLDVRLLPGESPEEFIAELRKVIDDDHIAIEPVNQFKPPNSSSTDTDLYRIIKQVVPESEPRALVVPGLNSGYTESQMYRPLGITCYGFSPILVTPELQATEHAANERVPVEQIRRGVRLLYEIVARAANQ